MKVGCDIGNVLVGGVRNGVEDTGLLGANWLEAPEIPGAIFVIQEIVRRVGKENFHFVSKCGDGMRTRTRKWLEHHNIWCIIGDVDPTTNLHFCYERGEKAGICEILGINVFIDDKIDCLLPMAGKVEHLYLFQPRKRDEEALEKALKAPQVLKLSRVAVESIKTVRGWRELMKDLGQWI